MRRRSNRIVYALNRLLKDRNNRILELEIALEYVNLNSSCTCHELPIYYKNNNIKCPYCYTNEILNEKE